MPKEARRSARSLLGSPPGEPSKQAAPFREIATAARRTTGQQGLCKINLLDGTATMELVSSPACSMDRKGLAAGGIIKATPPTPPTSLQAPRSPRRAGRKLKPKVRKAASNLSSSSSDEDTSRLLFPDALAGLAGGAITDSDAEIASRATKFMQTMTSIILHHRERNTTIPGLNGELNRLVLHNHLSPGGRVHLPAHLTTNRINHISVGRDDVTFDWPPYQGKNHDSGFSPDDDWQHRKVTISVSLLRGAFVNAEGVPLFPPGPTE